jgi:hypothetical protein
LDFVIIKFVFGYIHKPLLVLKVLGYIMDVSKI